MSKMQRDKGAGFERQVVEWLKRWGFEAKRNLSQSRDGGHDIDTDGLGRIECKRRRALAAYLLPVEGVSMVVARADRGEPVVVIRLFDFLSMAASARERAKDLAAYQSLGDPPPGIRERVLAMRQQLGIAGKEFDRMFADDLPGSTHFVGDDCPGGHREDGAK